MDTEKRVTIATLKDHGVLRSKMSEEESTEEENSSENAAAVEW